MARLGLCAALAAAPMGAMAQPPAGALLTAAPMEGAPAGAHAWRIHYQSQADTGQPEVVTGVVIAPDGPAPVGGRPVLAWAHGTWGVTERCAPSLSRKFFIATPGLADALARGFAVVATDYPGLGTPQPHGYLIGASAAHAVLDSVRAAGGLPDAGAGKRFAVWGESQGGHAALITGELAASYAPDLQLVGVAASAPPTDLAANLTGGKDATVRAFLTAYATYSWSQHFSVPLSSVGGPATQKRITDVAQSCVSTVQGPSLGAALEAVGLAGDLKGFDLGRTDPWAKIARENSAGAHPPGAPVFIAQNPKDAVVAPEITLAFARRLCAGGAEVRYVTIIGQSHVTSGKDSAKDALAWIAARFTGQPPPSDCGKI